MNLWRGYVTVGVVGFLPYERFIIESPLSMAEAEQRLRNSVAPPAFFTWQRPTQPFRGSVHGTTFTIHRVIAYRNSFRPRVTGRMTARGSGTAIELTMAMEPVVQVFMAVWLFAAAAIFVLFGIGLARDSKFTGDAGIFPLFFLPFGLAMCTFGYWLEAGKTKRALGELFNSYHHLRSRP